MKKIKFILLLFIGGLVTSCQPDYLSPSPSAGITADNFYKNETELQSALLSIYDAIQGVNSNDFDDNHAIQMEFYLTEMRSDNTRTKSQEGEASHFEFYTVQSTNGIVSNYYSSYYNVIFRANIVLDNIGVVSDASSRLAIEGEAKFLRAYAYFNLVRLYGPVPLIDRVIAPLEQDIQFKRIPTDIVYDLIESDLDVAIAGLDNSHKTRASKAAAQALKAKVLLTNHSDYLQAQTLLESVINSGDYDLLPEAEYQDVFFSERNKEIIFAIGFETALSNDSQNFSAEWCNGVGRSSGVNYLTNDCVTVLNDFGGSRTQYSYRNDPSQTTQNQVIKYLPNFEDGFANGATDGKTFVNDPTLAGNDWIVLRYSDVLLMYTEAIMAGADDTSNINAVDAFNKVRNRAGLPNDANGTVTVDELLLERRVELCFENHRLFDLIRFGKATQVLSAFAASIGASFTTTDLLLPIPQREINLSHGTMEQNSGY